MRKRLIALLLAMLLCGLSLAPAEGAVRLTDQQLISYYDHSLFIGDSITRQFHTFMMDKKRDEGLAFKMKLLTATSYSLYAASRNEIASGRAALTYQGKEKTMFRIVQQLQPDKLLILLGVNDYAGKQIDRHIGYVERIIDMVRKYSPETQIIFFSLTPVTKAFCAKADYRTMWDDYNAALEQCCAEKGALYLDIATPMKDEDGYLRKDFSSDGKFHLGKKALQAWLDVVLEHAQQAYEAGE